MVDGPVGLNLSQMERQLTLLYTTSNMSGTASLSPSIPNRLLAAPSYRGTNSSKVHVLCATYANVQL